VRVGQIYFILFSCGLYHHSGKSGQHQQNEHQLRDSQVDNNVRINESDNYEFDEHNQLLIDRYYSDNNFRGDNNFPKETRFTLYYIYLAISLYGLLVAVFQIANVVSHNSLLFFEHVISVSDLMFEFVRLVLFPVQIEFSLDSASHLFHIGSHLIEEVVEQHGNSNNDHLVGGDLLDSSVVKDSSSREPEISANMILLANSDQYNNVVGNRESESAQLLASFYDYGFLGGNELESEWKAEYSDESWIRRVVAELTLRGVQTPMRVVSLLGAVFFILIAVLECALAMTKNRFDSLNTVLFISNTIFVAHEIFFSIVLLYPFYQIYSKPLGQSSHGFRMLRPEERSNLSVMDQILFLFCTFACFSASAQHFYNNIVGYTDRQLLSTVAGKFIIAIYHVAFVTMLFGQTLFLFRTRCVRETNYVKCMRLLFPMYNLMMWFSFVMMEGLYLDAVHEQTQIVFLYPFQLMYRFCSFGHSHHHFHPKLH
jgi:hypothetical protein